MALFYLNAESKLMKKIFYYCDDLAGKIGFLLVTVGLILP